MDLKGRNMDLFNELTIQLLAKLYEIFPVAEDIFIADYPKLDNEQSSAIFFSTIQFLSKENYIGISEKVYGGFLGVTLTNNGFSALGVKPASISNSASIFELFKEALKKGTIESYSTCIKELTKSAVTASVERLTND